VVPYTSGYLDSQLTDASADTSGLATALDDFSFYLAAIDSPMAARGVRVVLRLGPLVAWTHAGRRDSLVLDSDSGVAYLFWSPSGPTVRRGVLTDVDLLGFVDSLLAVGRQP
jgi:hypothetical protein